MSRSAGYWITNLGLTPHPEGGFFREVYRSPESIPSEGLPARYPGPRSFATSIYFLLEWGSPSVLHRLRSDELWFFHEGGPIEIVMIDPAGNLNSRLLGLDRGRGEEPQAVIPAGTLFGARVSGDNAYSLAGCVVAPGFDFADFELPQREDLLRRHPEHAEIIKEFTARSHS